MVSQAGQADMSRVMVEDQGVNACVSWRMSSSTYRGMAIVVVWAAWTTSSAEMISRDR